MTRWVAPSFAVAAVAGMLVAGSVGLGSMAVVAIGPGVASAAAATSADLPTPTGTAADPTKVRQSADDILARPEYRPPEKTIGQEIGEKIQEILGKGLETLASGGGGSIFGWVVIGALVGGLVYFVVRVGRTVQRSPDQPVDVSIEVRRSPSEWRTEAVRFEAAGQWKEALRCRYRAMVSDLVDRKVVPDIPGRTVGEHRADVSTVVPDAAPEFQGAAELFERAWYGDLPTGEAENERFRALSDEIVHKADR